MKISNLSIFVSILASIILSGCVSGSMEQAANRSIPKEQASASDAEDNAEKKEANEKKETSEKASKTVNVKTGSKACALTFDDGPDKKDLKIMEILKEHNIKATFFLNTVKFAQYPEVIEMFKAENHVVGSHSHSHKNLKQASQAEQNNEIDKANEILSEYGFNIKHYRPAFGAITPYAEQKLKDLNLEVVLWNVDTIDYRANAPEDIIRRLDKVDTVKRPVILMHSIQHHTVAALPQIIETLKEKGCYFVTI